MRFILKIAIFIGLKIKEFFTSELVCIISSCFGFLVAGSIGIATIGISMMFTCGWVAHFFISIETARWLYKNFKVWDFNSYVNVGGPICGVFCISMLVLLVIVSIIYTCIQERNSIVQFFKDNWNKADEISKKIIKEK